jgi:outer membrane cobalamin receptor
LAWGRFFQAQDIGELQVQDNVTHFYPAERADHTVFSVEQRWSASQLRMEAYHKTYDHLRPRFENLFDPIVLLPELRPDRIQIAPSSARVTGVDFLYTVRSGPWSGSLSYSWSEALDHVDGRDVPRSWDQRHAVNATLTWSSKQYDISIADTFHTGWPTTAVIAEPNAAGVTYTIGPRNGDRVNNFNSFDVRMARHSEFAGGRLELFVEVDNVFNRDNACCTDYRTSPSDDLLHPHTINWLGIVPSAGMLWRY